MNITQLLLVGIVFVAGLGAAWMTGRAAALTWRPWWIAVTWLVPLSFGFRFVHFVFAHGDFLSPPAVLASLLYITVIGMAGYVVTQAGLMARQYPWLYERSSPFTWSERKVPPPGG